MLNFGVGRYDRFLCRFSRINTTQGINLDQDIMPFISASLACLAHVGIACLDLIGIACIALFGIACLFVVGIT
jgi:hypothetical protein